jgi:hypothetical protein
MKLNGKMNPALCFPKFLVREILVFLHVVHCVVGIVMEVPSGINLTMVKWVSARWRMKKKWKLSALVETTWVRWAAFFLSLHVHCVCNCAFNFLWDRSCRELNFPGVWPHVKENELPTSKAVVECVHVVLYTTWCWGECTNEEFEWGVIV